MRKATVSDRELHALFQTTCDYTPPRGSITLIGAQWGDEGKGKVIDLMTGHADIVARFGGGANAGHTIYVKDKKYVTHILPSGIVRRGVINLVGPGVVIDLGALRTELEIVNACQSQVYLDRSATVVHKIHRWFDAAREAAARDLNLGTTKRGIGPAYEDLASRRTVKLGDLLNADRVRKALTERSYHEEKRAAATAYPDMLDTFPTLDDIIDDLMAYQRDIRDLLDDTRERIALAQIEQKRILFEGAQGVMLDIFQGSQPYTTSSGCTHGAVGATFGVYDSLAVIGVAKAYATRVGLGPFPTELHDETGERMRQLGHEFGSTTGRPRRCGWLDLAALKYAARIGGITHLVITKLDILSAFDTIKVCTGYTFENRPVRDNETLTNRVLSEAVPNYVELPGWNEPIDEVRDVVDLPHQARRLIDLIELETERRVIAIGVGQEREQIAIA